jgi:hypothetical protein
MAKTVEVDLQVNNNLEPTIKNLRELKKQLRETAAGTKQFDELSASIRDMEDAISDAKATNDDFLGQLENASGPLGMLGQGIRGAERTFSSFNGALKASIIGAIVALVAGLAAAFSNNEKAQKKLQPIMEAFEKILGGVFAVVEPLFDVFIDLATKALPYVSDAFKVVYSSVTAVFQSLGKLGSAVKKLIGGDFSGAWDDAKSSVTGFSKNFNDAKDRFEKGSKEMTKAQKEEAAKQAEENKKRQEEITAKNQAEYEKRLAAQKEANQKAKEERERAAQEERDFFIGIDNVQREQRVADALEKEAADAKVLTDATAMVDALEAEGERKIDNEKKASIESIKNAQVEADAKRNINNIAIESAQGLVSILAGLGEKNKGIQRAALLANSALSIAQIIANTNVGSSKEVATKGIFGLSTSAVLYAKMGVSIASVLAATAKGLKGLGASGSAAASSGFAGATSGQGSATSPAAAPTFNVVGTSGQNQIAQSLGNQQPVRAFVVSNDVSTAQALDRNIVKTATIGG